MSNEATAPPNPSSEQPNVVTRFFHHVTRMPAWQKSVLIFACVLGGGGLALQGIHKMGATVQSPVVTTTQTQQTTGVSRDVPGASHAFGTTPAPSASPDSSSTTTTDTTTTTTDSSPVTKWATGVGVSYVGGFVIGWIFRAFLKTMAFLTAAGALLIGGLSYFNVLNVDMTAAKQKYSSGISWVEDQAGKLKYAAMAHLPSGATSLAGVLIGFKRK